MLAHTPPMGWNSWNTFGENISEKLIKEIADDWIELGLLDAGYQYLVIDDCWAEKKRGKDGLLVPDHNKFPNGMKVVSDYVHSKGLKFGMYSCVGTMTCAGYPGSLEHEFVDAETFAMWGVDYLKYDYCYKPHHIPGHILYKRMGMALKNCGRDILFSACNWGADDVYAWIRSTGAHMYRSTGDIEDKWESIRDIALSQMDKDCYSASHCYNDMDMLVVGMYGKGNVGRGGCSDEEYRTHFSLWCMMNSPLMIGCDIRAMNRETVNILTNKEIIALNQDPEGRQAYLIERGNIGYNNVKVLVKPISDGSFGIGFFNMGDTDARGSLQFWDIGLPSLTGYGFKMRDLWEHEDIGVYKENYTCDLKPHHCKVFRAKLVKD
ncbi:glycoside hydrolase family 27 protein [Mahella australiensis]|uniref:Alpha-galactosidase n=1 Tax=Mahella australiensis (strain DSM 15567 / CIP 107919 / 50-1 BON) TaxID=697281 RepID=F4A340_MAHA5|nr:glycoside hydrolase family 27 protein [Mahella australiensis]AEE96273.1 Alpha-galactosidase [Mahella australiensis 50-1 BON]